MKSKNSLANLYKQTLQERLWGFALSSIFFFFALPVFGVGELTRFLRNLNVGETTIVEVAAEFRSTVLGANNTLLMVMIIILAIFTGIYTFSYLFSKTKVDLYHSLPVRRNELFWANYLAGLTLFVVPYVFFVIITYLAAIPFGVAGIVGIKIPLAAMLLHILGFWMIYNVTVLAVMMTGTLAVSVLATGVFMSYGPICKLIQDILGTIFYATYDSKRVYSQMPKLSPISIYVYNFEQFSARLNKVSLNMPYFVIMLVVSVVSLAIAYVLFHIRKSEVSGKPMAFEKTMPGISVLILIPAALVGGSGFYSIIADSTVVNMIWYIFGTIITIVLGHGVIQAIYYQDFRSLKKNLANPLIAAVVVAGITVFYAYDLGNYDDFLPAENKLDSIAISSYSLEANVNYYNAENQDDEMAWMLDRETYRLGQMHVTDRNAIENFVQMGIGESKEYKQMSSDLNMIRSYNQNGGDWWSDNNWIYMTIQFNLKNGKKIYRDYNIRLDKEAECFANIYNSKEYKEGVYQILTIPDEEIKDFAYCGVNNEESKRILTKEQCRELVRTYREELLGFTLQELRKSPAIGYIYKNIEMDYGDGYISTMSACEGFVYPSFSKTIALLEQYGYDVYADITQIEMVKVTDWNPGLHKDATVTADAVDEEMVYAYTDGDTAEYVFTAPEDVDEILKQAYDYTCIGQDCAFFVQKDMDVEVHYKTDALSDKLQNLCFVKDKLPACVQTAMAGK